MAKQTNPTEYWKLPHGVSRGTWEYAHTDSVANDYDEYFDFDESGGFDARFVKEAIMSSDSRSDAIVADLGTGTARALIPLMREGFRGLGIDLSQRMLEVAVNKAAEESLDLQPIRANLVELDCVRDQSVDHAICLFSTLGMIRGRTHRAQMLRHVRRILRPGGLFIVHVHNYWHNLFDPGGPWWLVSNLFRSIVDRDLERGDKYYSYRKVTRMYLHVFTRRELRRLLHQAGFSRIAFTRLHQNRTQELPRPWLLGGIRASGWMVTCR